MLALHVHHTYSCSFYFHGSSLFVYIHVELKLYLVQNKNKWVLIIRLDHFLLENDFPCLSRKITNTFIFGIAKSFSILKD